MICLKYFFWSIFFVSFVTVGLITRRLFAATSPELSQTMGIIFDTLKHSKKGLEKVPLKAFFFKKDCYKVAKNLRTILTKHENLIESSDFLLKKNKNKKNKLIQTLKFFVSNAEAYIVEAFNRNKFFSLKSEIMYEYDESVCPDVHEFIQQIKNLD